MTKPTINSRARALRVLLSMSCAAAAFVTAPAFAQVADTADQAASLDEVVVTAERRATNVQRTPISIVAFNEEALEQRGVETVEDLARFTPGLSAGGDVEGGSIKPVFVIRGIGQSSGRETIERGVGLYVDDIYIPRTTGTFLQLLDVERVEVLRGPQGTLFGRNSTGGAIRYVTRKPTQDFGGNFSADVGSYGRVDLSGLVNIPFGERIAGRFQFGSFNRDGYITTPNSNETRGDMADVVARAAFRVWATDNLTIDAGVSYQNSTSSAPAQTVLGVSTTSPQSIALSRYLVANGQPALTTDDPRFVLADRYAGHGQCFIGRNTFGQAAPNGRNAFNEPGYCDDFGIEQTNLIGFVDARLTLSDSLSIRSITGYVDGSSDATTDWTAMGLFYTRERSEYDSISQEIQISYDTDRVNAVGGAYYFSENPVAENFNRNLVFQGPASPNTGACCSGFNRVRDLQTDSYGIFGQVSFEMTDALSLVLGGRYSNDTKVINVSRTDRPTATPGITVRAEDSWDAFDYRATLQFQATPDVMFYATASSGFKSGGFNDDVQAVPAANGGIIPYEPETVKSYEIGARSQFLDNRLRLNFTGFFMDYEDLQLATPIIDTTGGGVNVLLTLANAGRVELSGFEGEANFRVTPNFTINAAFATLDQEYKELATGSALLESATCSNPAVRTLDTCAAQDVARSPKLQFTVGSNYDWDLSSGDQIGLSAAYAWVEEQQSSNSTDNSVLLPSYGTLNLRAEYRPQNAPWTVAGYITNATDEYYLSTASDFRGFFGTITGAPGRPREAGVQLKVSF